MFIKINKKNELIEYPSDPWKDYPNQFKPDWQGGIINEDIYVDVERTDVNEHLFSQKAIEKNPEFINEKWKQVWEIVDLTEEELNDKRFYIIYNLKIRRNELLDKTDYTQMPDNKMSAEKKEAWAKFRQELRDMFNQGINAEDIRFPAIPKFAAGKQPEFEGLMEI
jgi:hypothetical protein